MHARGASLHTIRNYLSDVRQFLACAREAGFNPLELDRSKLFLYLGYLRKTYTNNSTIARKRDSVKQFYRLLKLDGHVNRNELEFIDRIRQEKKLPGHLSQTEAAKLIDSIDVSPKLCDKRLKWFGVYFERSAEAAFLAVRDRALIETIYGTGTRAQETANLNWCDVDFRAGFIRVNDGKGDVTGSCRLSPPWKRFGRCRLPRCQLLVLRRLNSNGRAAISPATTIRSA